MQMTPEQADLAWRTDAVDENAVVDRESRRCAQLQGAVVDQADGQRRVRFGGNLVVQQNRHIRRGGDGGAIALDTRCSLNLRDRANGTLGVRGWGRCYNHQHRHEEQHRNSPRDHIALPLLPAITAFTPERAFRAALWHTVELDENLSIQPDFRANFPPTY